ncbi:MAG: hypothetical protein WC753_04670 [Candidatus Gracilibacteria bacterium]|jgi:hypothetical protein
MKYELIATNRESEARRLMPWAEHFIKTSYGYYGFEVKYHIVTMQININNYYHVSKDLENRIKLLQKEHKELLAKINNMCAISGLKVRVLKEIVESV